MADASEILDAVRRGDAARADALLRADPALAGARDATGVSLVLVALYHGHETLARRLAAGRAVDLFEAAALGDAPRARALLAQGAEASARAPDGFTALHLAAYFGRAEVARLLLDAGADPDAVAGNASQVRPLHSAAATRGSFEVGALLLQRGADPNARQRGGFTPLHSRALHGDAPFVDLLLRHGADPLQRAEDGRSAVDMARAAGHERVVGRLESAGRS